MHGRQRAAAGVSQEEDGSDDGDVEAAGSAGAEEVLSRRYCSALQGGRPPRESPREAVMDRGMSLPLRAQGIRFR